MRPATFSKFLCALAVIPLGLAGFVRAPAGQTPDQATDKRPALLIAKPLEPAARLRLLSARLEPRGVSQKRPFTFVLSKTDDILTSDHGENP